MSLFSDVLRCFQALFASKQLARRLRNKLDSHTEVECGSLNLIFLYVISVIWHLSIFVSRCKDTLRSSADTARWGLHVGMVWNHIITAKRMQQICGNSGIVESCKFLISFGWEVVWGWPLVHWLCRQVTPERQHVIYSFFILFSVDSLSFSEDLDRLRQEVRRLSVQVEIAERECGEEARPHSASLFWQYQSAMLLRADIKRIILTILNIHFSCFSTGRRVLDFLALKHWNGRQTDSTNKARTPWLWPQVDRWHNMA